MRIIIGLGNPGKEYENTRHNIGFEIMDKIKTEWNFPDFEFNKKIDSEISVGNISVSSRAKSAADEVEGSTPEKVLLVKPQKFMNLSGEVVRDILAFYKLTPDDIVVIHDDLDIAIGKYKIATDSSSAGHNGVQNIIDTLSTQKFQRLRVGIGEEKNDAPVCRLGAHDFVLDKFSEDETKKIYPALLQIVETEIPKLISETK